MAAPMVLVVNEHEEIALPDGLLSAGTPYVDAFQEALARNYFSIRMKAGKLILQAGGYVGVIAVNGNLLLDIRPKVPLRSLERLLALAQGCPIPFAVGRRTYSASNFIPNSVSEFLWREFLAQAEFTHQLGVHRRYTESSGNLKQPHGRIDPFKTRIASMVGGCSVASCTWQTRTKDTAPNRLIKYLLHAYLQTLSSHPDRALRRRVAYCLSLYDDVPLDHTRSFLDDEDVRNPARLGWTKDHYQPVIKLALLIFAGQGLGFLDRSSNPIEASSLLISMEDVFEGYVRNVLSSNSTLSQANIRVLDGNKGGNEGAKQDLLVATTHPAQIGTPITATPDVVLRSEQKTVVIDVKYKNVKRADRSDLNQVIAYACSYSACAAVLLFPANEHNKGLKCLGAFGSTNVFEYYVDLTSPDIEEEEGQLSECLGGLVA